MRAQEYFEDVRAIVVDIERSRDVLTRLISQEELQAQHYGQPQGAGSNDTVDKINQRLEFEKRLKCRIEESQEILAEANVILYGSDGHGGLAKLKGNRYADVVCMAYLQAMSWGEVAEIMRCSPKWCRELRSAAFAYIDNVGISNLVANSKN